ncbi:flavodoxin family protein [Caproiciproducens sp.]
MNIAVRYYSRGGNTKKVADAIAKAVGVEAKDCSVPINGPVDLLFLGGSVYWGGIDKNLKQFIARLKPENVKCVAAFGTSALKKEPDGETEKLVEGRSIPVSKHSFHCRGAFSAMHKGHPDSSDLKQAAAFAATALKDLK